MFHLFSFMLEIFARDPTKLVGGDMPSMLVLPLPISFSYNDPNFSYNDPLRVSKRWTWLRVMLIMQGTLYILALLSLPWCIIFIPIISLLASQTLKSTSFHYLVQFVNKGKMGISLEFSTSLRKLKLDCPKCKLNFRDAPTMCLF